MKDVKVVKVVKDGREEAKACQTSATPHHTTTPWKTRDVKASRREGVPD